VEKVVEEEDENENPGTPTRVSRDVRPDALARKPSRKEIKELKEKEKEVSVFARILTLRNRKM
jgi:hypothetical protein